VSPRSRVRDASWALADALRVDLGETVEVHDDGVSLDELQRRYAGPAGTPDAAGFERFAAELFGITFTPQQSAGAQDLASQSRVLIIGANGLGKDALLGCWALYEAYIVGSLVLVTAPSDRQVKEIMMGREIGGRWLRAKERLPGQLLDRGLRIPGHAEGGLLAFTTDDPSRFQGFHAPRVCIIATESQGIDRGLFNAMRRCLPKLIALSANPTSVLSVVYSFAQSDAWCTRFWSALDHPNVVTGTEIVPGAVTREMVDEIRRTDGEGSRFWQETVLGVFVQEVEDGIAAPEDVTAATDRDRMQQAAAQIIPLDPPNQQSGHYDDHGRPHTRRPSDVAVGIDPGGKGRDSTALAVLVRIEMPGALPGIVVFKLHEHHEGDAVENAKRLTDLIARLVGTDRLAVQTITVDETSLGAVLSPLKRMIPQQIRWGRVVPSFPNYDWVTTTPTVRGFNSSWQALAPARFANLRAQSYHTLGELLQERRLVYAPSCDPKLVHRANQEILAHRLIRQPDGKWLATKKDEVKALIGRSPNLSDALAMALLPWLKKEKPELAPHKRVRVLIGG
jgi:hypothetical protein